MSNKDLDPRVVFAANYREYLLREHVLQYQAAEIAVATGQTLAEIEESLSRDPENPQVQLLYQKQSEMFANMLLRATEKSADKPDDWQLPL